MKAPPKPADESARLLALRRYALYDQDTPVYEAIVKRAARLCATPIAAISLIDDEHVRFKAKIGLEELDTVSRDISFSAHAILSHETLIVPDARTDERFADNPLVAGAPYLRFYAGAPLVMPDGTVIGTLAVADRVARSFLPEQRAALEELRSVLVDIIEARRNSDTVERRKAQQQLRLLSQAIDDALEFVTIADATPPARGGPFVEYVNSSFLLQTGYAPEDVVGKPYLQLLAAANDPKTLESVADALERGTVIEKEALVCRKDGSSLWVEFSCKPVYDIDGVFRHWVSVGRDITLRHQSEEQTLTLLSAIEGVRDAIEIYTVDRDEFSLVFQNRAALERDSRTLERLLSTEDYKGGPLALRKRLRSGKPVRLRVAREPEGEQRGDSRWLELEIRPLRNSQGAVATVVCVEREAETAGTSV